MAVKIICNNLDCNYNYNPESKAIDNKFDAYCVNSNIIMKQINTEEGIFFICPHSIKEISVE